MNNSGSYRRTDCGPSADAAYYLGVPVQTLYGWRGAGVGPLVGGWVGGFGSGRGRQAWVAALSTEVAA